MHKSAQRLMRLGFKSALGPDAEYVDNRLIYGKLNDDLITVPGLPNYLPPMIPDKPDWLDRVQHVVRASFYGLIADIWTQILVSRGDAKEKPMYMLWDDAIPKPSRLSSLAWLLTCEVWPMPDHRITSSDVRTLFPPQPFSLPQSTPYGYAGTQPHGYAKPAMSLNLRARTLNSLFAQCLNRNDREYMTLVQAHMPMHRPPAREATAYGFHIQESFESTYGVHRRWARTTSRSIDAGYGAYEIQESDLSHKVLQRLRADVMHPVLMIPGLVTHRDNLHNAPGMWIRDWSESGLMLTVSDRVLPWSPEHDSIKLENGISLANVPAAASRFWMGFTCLGPQETNVVQPGDTHTSLAESASERWAAAYLKHRHQAIKMLFAPESVSLNDLEEEATSTRAKLLERAGRLKKSKAGGGFAAAFANIIKKETQE